MMSQTSPRLRRSNLWLRWTQSLRKRGLRSTIRKTERRLEKAQERLLLLDLETRHQLLLLKELSQTLAASHHRIEELNPSPSLEMMQQGENLSQILQQILTVEQSNSQ